MKSTLSLQERADRFLLVLYRLSHGVPGIINIKTQRLAEECERLKVFEMSATEFENLRRESVSQFSKGSAN